MGKGLRRLVGRRPKGQGLVEMALALPVLLIMLLGLVEVGFLLRTYLVVYNADREAARFAARGGFTGEEIKERALTSFSGQLPVSLGEPDEPDGNTIIYVTWLQIPSDAVDDDDWKASYHKQDSFGTFEPSSRDPISKIDAVDQWKRMKDWNAALNDAAGEDGLGPTSLEVVIVEIFYEHNQVLHAPVIEWFLPDPMEVYAWTTMRIIERR